MLSKGFGDDEEYLETLLDLRLLKYSEQGYQRTLRDLWGPDDGEFQLALRDLRNSESRGYGLWKIEKSVLRGVERLAKQLQPLESKKRWEMVNEVWIEMVAYAAAQCPWKEHIHQLRRGGELLTHVFLLMLHLGLSEQYEFKGFDDFNKLKGVSIQKILLN